MSWQALGTSVVLQVSDPQALTRARATLAAHLDSIDRAASRFRDDSELEQLNSKPGRFVAVSPLLLDAIGASLRAAALTEGAVDPTLGEAIAHAGYTRDWELLEHPGDGDAPYADQGPQARSAPSATTVLQARRVNPWELVELRSDPPAVCIPPGVRLDLGATAKALIADIAAQAIASDSGIGALVCLGGDVAVAGPPPPGGWTIRVTDDHRADLAAAGQTVAISSGGLATSSTTVRRWLHQGRAMHHILDPATGEPTTGPWRTVSVAAASCLDANIASTAAIVFGSAATAWLDQRALPARLVTHAGRAHRVAGWPEDDGVSEPQRLPAP